MLTDEHRRDLPGLLRERPYAVSELVDSLHLGQPAVPKHLRVLREAGFVRVAREAQRRIYTIDATRLAELTGAAASRRAAVALGSKSG